MSPKLNAPNSQYPFNGYNQYVQLFFPKLRGWIGSHISCQQDKKWIIWFVY